MPGPDTTTAAKPPDKGASTASDGHLPNRQIQRRTCFTDKPDSRLKSTFDKPDARHRATKASPADRVILAERTPDSVDIIISLTTYHGDGSMSALAGGYRTLTVVMND
jgi:hypothetical protein